MSGMEERGAEMDRRELEAEILAHLEEKADHEYQWPRWPAAYEAAEAVLASDWLAAHDARVRAEALAPIEAAARDIYLTANENRGTRTAFDASLHAEKIVRAAMEAKG